MNERDLVAIIVGHRSVSLGAGSDALSSERASALDHYHGRPYGNEQEGRSSVVSKDLSEAVDWAMPAILRVLMASGNIAEFEPTGPEDEQGAMQESDVVNKVFMQDNPGFMIAHDAVKDALLLKNGYIKHSWEESEEAETTSYTGLPAESLAMLFDGFERDGATVEVLGQEQSLLVEDSGAGPIQVPIYNVRLRVTRKKGRVVCEAVPPEELRVSRKCRGALSESPFVEHVTRKTRSDLIEMGMSRSFVESLSAHAGVDNDAESLARDSVDSESRNDGMAFIDRSMDEIDYCEAYLRVDWDGDGIAELRKVVTVADRIPPGDEWNEEIDAIPISGGVPKRIPHRHVGESLDDDVADLQEIKTTLLRQMFDNIYLTNNNQWLVNERVNLPDFLRSLPGGIKRVKGLDPVSGAVEAVMATPIISQVMPAIDYVDGIKEARTGINRATTGLDPDVLKQSTKGAYMENLNRASQKIEMITRMLAETLFKPTLLAVHALLLKHQDKPMVTRLRGEFVTVDPGQWKHRADMTLRVGIGTGNEEEKRQKLMLLSQMQERLQPFGLVDPMQSYNLFADIARSMGFDMPEKYALSPLSPEFAQKQQQPRPPDPLVQVEQIKQQGKQAELQVSAGIEAQKAAQNAQQEQLRSANDVQIERERIASQAELERFKAQLKAETEIQIAQIRAAADQQSVIDKTNLTVGADQHAQAMQQILANYSGQEQAIRELVGQLAAKMEGSRVKSIRKVRGKDGRLIGGVQVLADGTEVPIQIQ